MERVSGETDHAPSGAFTIGPLLTLQSSKGVEKQTAYDKWRGLLEALEGE